MKAISRYFEDLPIKDAKDDLTIRITPHDIECAVPSDPRQCAMAQAARRALEADDVCVFHGVTYMRIGDEVFRYTNPSPLVREVIDPLDKGEPVAGGIYRLKAPTSSTRKGAAAKRRRTFEDRLAKGEAKRRSPIGYTSRAPKTAGARLMAIIGKSA